MILGVAGSNPVGRPTFHGALSPSPFNMAQACGAMPWPQGLRTKAKISANLLKIARLIQRLAVNWVALPGIDENSRWNGSFDHLVSLIPVENDQRNFLSTPAT